MKDADQNRSSVVCFIRERNALITCCCNGCVQGSCINVMHSAIGPHGVHPRQEEVAMSLEAVSGAVQVSGRPWQMQRKRRRDGANPNLPFNIVLNFAKPLAPW